MIWKCLLKWFIVVVSPKARKKGSKGQIIVMLIKMAPEPQNNRLCTSVTRIKTDTNGENEEAFIT